MSKPTPGPWIAQSHSRTHYVTTANHDEPELIADVYPGNTNSASANARLIAAAPELFESLGRIEAIFQEAMDEDGFYDRAFLTEALDDYRATWIAALEKSGVR